MSVAREEPPRLTFEEYLRFEELSEVRHELVDGHLRAMDDVFAMSGGSNRHNRAANRISALLTGPFEDQGCRVYQQGEALRVADDRSYYPDVFVTCGPEVGPRHEDDARWVVEVLSPGTRATDEGEKSRAFLALPSLQGYLLVDTDAEYVEVRRPVPIDVPAGRFTVEIYPVGAGHRVDLGPVGLDVDELFERLNRLSPR